MSTPTPSNRDFGLLLNRFQRRAVIILDRWLHPDTAAEAKALIADLANNAPSSETRDTIMDECAELAGKKSELFQGMTEYESGYAKGREDAYMEIRMHKSAPSSATQRISYRGFSYGMGEDGIKSLRRAIEERGDQ